MNARKRIALVTATAALGGGLIAGPAVASGSPAGSGASAASGGASSAAQPASDTRAAGFAAPAKAAGQCSHTSSIGFYCGQYKGSALTGPGNSGKAVKEIQLLLNETTNAPGTLKVDGHFGAQTKKAVVWFQKKYNVKPYDGIVGQKTWKELRLK